MSVGNNTNRSSTRNGLVCIPNVMLKSLLKSTNDRLNYCHVNAGSIPPKIDEFRSYFEGTNVDIVIASETWMKSYHSDRSVSLNGFEIVRNDRYAKRSGGVALYIRESLNYKVIKMSDKISSEFLFIEVIFPDSKLLVGAYYKAPNVRELDVLEDVLLELTVSYDDVLLLGDFNENLLGVTSGNCASCVNHTCTNCEFADVVDKFGLMSVGSIPSHYPIVGRPSLIDLCLTNRPEKVLFYSQISHGLSKHDMIFGSYSCNKRGTRREPRLVRSFARVNVSELNYDASVIGWNDVFYATSVSDKVDVFNSKVLSLLDKHAPLKPIANRCRESPLSSTEPFSHSIRRAMLERDIAEIEFRNGRVTRAHYNRLRNFATSLISKAKYEYLQPKLHVNLGSKALWRNLREIGAVSSSNVKPGFTADEFNAHLTKSKCGDDDLSVDADGCADSGSGLSFSFGNVTSIDVVNAMNSIKSKALGLDNVPLTFVRMFLPFVLPPLTHIINYAFTSSTVPRAWKLSRVLPVHKKTMHRGLDDFRPISILPCLSKVFEILAKEQIVGYLVANDLVDRYQSGFRAKHSTGTALLHVSDEIRRSFDKRCHTIMVLLDFSKAFDSLSHPKLLSKLSRKFGFVASATDLIRSYLSERYQCVNIGDHLSEPLITTAGIPQGSVLGPLLFSLYINDLPRCLKSVNYHVFADDVQLFLSFKKGTLNEAVFRMNQNLYEVSRWARDNSLSLNAKKSQVIIFSELGDAQLRPCLLPNVILNGVPIPYAERVLNLGLLMDRKLLFRDQVKEVCSKVYARLRSLWPNSHLFPLKTRLMLVRSLVVPAFTYGECVYSTNLRAVDVRSLERAFSACVRFVYRLRRYDSTREYVTKILGCPIMAFLEQRRCAMVHRIAKAEAPSYLCDRLCRGSSSRNNAFIIPMHSTAQYNRSFFVRAVSDYNLIPASIRRLGSLSRFGAAYRQYLGTH